MIDTGLFYLWNKRVIYIQVGSLFSLGLTLKVSGVTRFCHHGPYKQLSADQWRAAWFMGGSYKVNGQHPVWEATTLIKEGKNKSARWAEFYAVFLAIMEELNNDKSPFHVLPNRG